MILLLAFFCNIFFLKIKNVRNGAQAYLVYVQAKPKTQMKLEDIPIVCHYLDV